MSLSSGKYWLLGDRQRTSGTYHLVLTVHIPTAFQPVAMEVGNSGASICNVTPDMGNDGVDI